MAEVCKIIEKENYVIENVDVTVLLEKPKLRGHIDKMRGVVSDVMKIEITKLSIKATTTEGLGFVGREEGVAAHCVALVSSNVS